MNKILLINPDEIYHDPPLGLAYIAAYLRKNKKVNIKILDKLNIDKIVKKAIEFSPDLIGISAVSNNYWKAKDIAMKIKKLLPTIPLVVGGVHVTTSPDSFERSPFDFAIIGEGEITFLELINALERNKPLNKVKGILYRKNKKIIFNQPRAFIQDLDDIPIPARDLLDMNYYRIPLLTDNGLERIGTIISSRGCPYDCTFCASSVLWNRRIRFFSAKRTAEEIEILHRMYGFKKIMIYDDLFTINKSRIRELISILKIKGLLGNMEFYCYGRANVFDEETATLLKQMNVRCITFGLETGSEKMLKYLKNENVTVNDGVKALRLCEKYGILGYSFFMIGSPHETEEDIKKTYEFIKNNKMKGFIVYQTIAFPGTKVWEYALEKNIISKDYYETEQREFAECDLEYLLSKDISPERFKEWFDRLKDLYQNKDNSILKYLALKNFIYLFDIAFLNKAIKRLSKRII